MKPINKGGKIKLKANREREREREKDKQRIIKYVPIQ